MEKLVATTAR